jgi:hypothetical protein
VSGSNAASPFLSLLTARLSTSMELTFLGLASLQRRPTTLKLCSGRLCRTPRAAYAPTGSGQEMLWIIDWHIDIISYYEIPAWSSQQIL